MGTMLLRLAGPLQSWGMDTFERRGTETAPTKSGVIGMLAAALGRRRHECNGMDDLASLRFGVRVEQAGGLLKDFHTAKSTSSAYITYRYYLSDAVFLVGLEGDNAFLNTLERALKAPAFPLFLGRRSCPPEGRVFLKIENDKNLIDALTYEPTIIPDDKKPIENRRIVIDADDNSRDTYFQRDVPVSFDQTHRKYGFRRVSEPRRIHNPMQELETMGGE